MAIEHEHMSEEHDLSIGDRVVHGGVSLHPRGPGTVIMIHELPSGAIAYLIEYDSGDRSWQGRVNLTRAI